MGFNIEEQEGANRAPVSEEAAYRFWQHLIKHRVGGSPLRIRDIDRLADYLAAARAGHVDHTPYEPIPTVAWDGQVVLLSPELLGVTDPGYGDFFVGNLLDEPITAMLTRADHLRYITEFVTALNDLPASRHRPCGVSASVELSALDHPGESACASTIATVTHRIPVTDSATDCSASSGAFVAVVVVVG